MAANLGPSYLILLPYLTMSQPIEFGGWWLGPLADFEGEWHSDQFRDLSTEFVAAFRDASDNPIQRPAILARSDAGVTGELPEPTDFAALQRAIHFGSLIRNPPWQPEEGNEGFWTSTSDNSEIIAWGLDLEGRGVSVTRGSMVRVQHLGYTIGPDLLIRAPLELHLPASRPFDDETLKAVYEILTNEDLGDRLLAHRLGVAIDWLAHAWRNSRSITFENRVVMLKTAFDALTGSDKTHNAAMWIQGKFQALADAGVDDEHSGDLLWSPLDEERHERVWNGQTVLITDLVHWFHALGATRNQIVHEGSADTLTYEMEGSAYEGPLPNVGERFLRETIQVVLRDFGFDDLWEPHSHRMIKRALEAAYIQIEEE
jgi:hypothetical protein